MKPIYSLFIMLSFAGQLRAQNDTTELFPYGDMNQWMVRVVDESLVIGGNTKYLYEITPGDTLKNNSRRKGIPVIVPGSKPVWNASKCLD